MEYDSGLTFVWSVKVVVASLYNLYSCTATLSLPVTIRISNENVFDASATFRAADSDNQSACLNRRILAESSMRCNLIQSLLFTKLSTTFRTKVTIRSFAMNETILPRINETKSPRFSSTSVGHRRSS